jgi:hypothetical protein
MPVCYARHDEICFENQKGDDDNWLRGDLYEADSSKRLAVGFDRGGLCFLDREDCRQLAAWLLAVSDRIPKAEPVVAKVRGRRKASQRQPPMAAEPEGSDEAA